jgi:hypothetical protein
VNQGVVAANREPRKLLGLSVSHIPGDGQELLEKEEHAQCSALRVALPNKIETEREGNEQLQKCAARDGGSQPENPKEGMPAGVNLQENVVYQAGHFRVAQQIV